MNVAILGSGGREHALAAACAACKDVQDVWVIPGNGGTEHYFKNVSLVVASPFTELVALIKAKDIDLVLVGPEQYLCTGVVDVLSAAGIAVWGPTAAAARLEGSKVFAKDIMHKAGVPTPAYAVFSQLEAAQTYLTTCKFPIVLKADGLCAGKGVIIANELQEALAALDVYWVEKRFAAAADKVLIEEYLEGPEVSLLALTDGKTVRILEPAQDHKRLYDQDEGPNTGGMGVYAPVPFLKKTELAMIETSILLPVLNELRSQATPFKGVLYAGLMKDRHKGYQVLEFNVRFGDPECQCVLPLFTGNLLEVVQATFVTELATLPREYFSSKQAAVTVVLASAGYPQTYQRGHKITGLDNVKHSLIFHAGTRYVAAEQTFYTAGGRVLALTACAPTLAEARRRVYADAEVIQFTGKYYRRDIGEKGLVT